MPDLSCLVADSGSSGVAGAVGLLGLGRTSAARSGTFNTDHTSPFSRRWGGWYVTGQHGSMRHMGNVIANKRAPEELDREAGANVTDLNKIVPVDHYLTPHSDLVALMVLEHQVQMHNYITLASFETRNALHHDQIMNKALEREADYRSRS